MPDPTGATRPGPQDRTDGMRVIIRRECPHPGAQLCLTDSDGWRITCVAANARGPWPDATGHRVRPGAR
ncbi:hypothetical protein GCM10027068_11730 [Prescottella soli]